MPFRTPGSGLPRRRGFATTVPAIVAFAAPGSSCEHRGAWVPVHAPPCQGKSRFSEPRRRPPTSATELDARTHLRAVDPRTRVRLSPHYSGTSDAGCVGLPGALPHWEPASRGLPAPAFTVAVHLRGRGRSRAGTLEERRTRALDERACPTRRAPGTRVTGSTHHLAWTTW